MEQHLPWRVFPSFYHDRCNAPNPDTYICIYPLHVLQSTTAWLWNLVGRRQCRPMPCCLKEGNLCICCMESQGRRQQVRDSCMNLLADVRRASTSLEQVLTASQVKQTRLLMPLLLPLFLPLFLIPAASIIGQN